MTSTNLPAQVNNMNSQILGASTDENQILTFELGGELYGVDILKVQEIRGWNEPTQIPNAPDFIRGVVNLRGEIVPILDMRRRFNLEETEFTMYTVVIVLNVHNRTVGIVVDAVSDVVDVEAGGLRPAPDFGTSIDSSFVQGLYPIEESMAILLNIDKLLASSELLQLDGLTNSADAGDDVAE